MHRRGGGVVFDHDVAGVHVAMHEAKLLLKALQQHAQLFQAVYDRFPIRFTYELLEGFGQRLHDHVGLISSPVLGVVHKLGDERNRDAVPSGEIGEFPRLPSLAAEEYDVNQSSTKSALRRSAALFLFTANCE